MHPFTQQKRDSVGSLGEARLIASIKVWLGKSSPPTPRGMGDDCAILAPSSVPQVITVDPIIFGRHFDGQVAARDAGAKLLKRNLSDLAAMGASPTAAVVALALDPAVKIAWLGQFYRGLARAATQFGVSIVGGDVAQAPPGTLVASLTLLGQATGARLLTRRGAKIGDWIYVTGELGGSLGGHHYRFIPRLPEGAWLAKELAVRSMMDLSDGLAKDLPALTPENGRPSLHSAVVPIARAAHRFSRKTHRTALDHALTDGEDYELVFTLAKNADQATFERRWRKKFRTRLTCVGAFVAAEAPADGSLRLDHWQGYEHFR